MNEIFFIVLGTIKKTVILILLFLLFIGGGYFIFKKSKNNSSPISPPTQENWGNISSEFSNKPELIDQWKNLGFTCQQTKEWIDIGLNHSDAPFAEWLRDSENKNPEQVLNYGDMEELRSEHRKSRLEREANRERDKERLKTQQIEEIKAQIVTILVVWRDNSTGQEKKAVIKAIKQLLNDKLPQEQQYKRMQSLLSNYPNDNVQLNNLAASWKEKKQE